MHRVAARGRELGEETQRSARRADRACHEALRENAWRRDEPRVVTPGSMTWLGVGNVEAILVQPARTTEAIPSRGGTVGYLLPKLTVTNAPGAPRRHARPRNRWDSSGFKQEVRATRSPQEIAERIVEHWARETDDCCASSQGTLENRHGMSSDPRRAQLEHEYSTALKDCVAVRARLRSPTPTSSVAWRRARASASSSSPRFTIKRCGSAR